ncbi:hypothetical protein GDO78_001773 [Eleutherodactylus coqui]|uniref:Uncharacterized protein n=1 Tax=Eleutherodactylus coqui TaxID=57060 RepID=A0A8J6KJ72_ELECQ|nr:hypothetical protein GDO78_001773 [Eleutherodactylus coqui]
MRFPCLPNTELVWQAWGTRHQHSAGIPFTMAFCAKGLNKFQNCFEILYFWAKKTNLPASHGLNMQGKNIGGTENTCVTS